MLWSIHHIAICTCRVKCQSWASLFLPFDMPIFLRKSACKEFQDYRKHQRFSTLIKSLLKYDQAPNRVELHGNIWPDM